MTNSTADLSESLFGINQPTAHTLSGTLASGDLALHRRGRDRRQQGLLLPKRIDVVLFQHTAPLQQAHDPLGGGLDDPLYVVIAQLRRLHETRCAVFVGDVKLSPDLSTGDEDSSDPSTGRHGQFADLIKNGLMNDGDILWREYGPRGQDRIRYEGVARPEGIEIDDLAQHLDRGANPGDGN